MIRTKLWRDIPVALVVVAVVAALLYPLFATAKIPHHRPPCLSNAKQMSLGMVMYLGDFDRYPSRDAWVDQDYPYTRNWEVFHCPSFDGTKWGYAFNGALSNAKEPPNPAEMPLLYDSVNPVKNASDLVASVPAVPRHKTNVMGYADGHAKAIDK